MGDPINYQSQLTPANPIAAFGQGFGLVSSIRDRFDARAAAQAQAQAQADREAQLSQIQAKLRSPGATAQDRIDYLMMVSPEQSNATRQAFDQMDKNMQQAALQDSGKLVSAFMSGNTEVAMDLLDEKIEAAKNSGNDQNAQFLSKIRQSAEINPAVAQNFFANSLALMPGGKEVLDSINKNLAAPGERGLTKAQEALAWAQAARAGLGGDLSPEADKIINSATDSVSSSLLLASQADNLAKAFDSSKPAGGWTSQALEAFKRAAGTQDKFTSLRQEYTRLRNTDVLKNLPPGVASDKDIEIALAAFPKDDANPEQISGFLKGMAKLQRYSAEVNKARAEWVIQNGNLGPARAPLTVGGDEVDKGTSFWDFTKAIPIPNVAPGASEPSPVTVKFGASSATPTTATPKKTVEVAF